MCGDEKLMNGVDLDTKHRRYLVDKTAVYGSVN